MRSLLSTLVSYHQLKQYHLIFQILEEIEEASIRIYQFPECDSDEDEDFVEMNKDLKVGLT